MANPASDELVAVEIADLRDEVTSLQAKLDEAAKAYTSLFSAFLAAQSEREAEKARADKAEAERDAIDRSRTFHAARATTAEAERDRLAAVVAEAQAERDEHLRLKNKLVLDAYRALDAVDAIRDGFRSAVHFVRNNAMNMERDYPEIVAAETALKSTLSARAWQEKHGEARTDA